MAFINALNLSVLFGLSLLPVEVAYVIFALMLIFPFFAVPRILKFICNFSDK